MELILWRHAEAADPEVGLADLQRPLTGRGKKQAGRVADWIRAHQPEDLRILVSPAKRCQQTAKALALPCQIEPKLGTGANLKDLLAAANWPGGDAESPAAVLLVGHQPTLGCLAAWLLSGREADWNFKKGALWWFSSRAREGQTQTVLRAVIDPDMI